MLFGIFRNFLVLFCIVSVASFGQVTEDEITIELGQTNFPIERPFTISVIIPNSETRPTINFPEIVGFVKRGISASVTPSEINGKTITNQVITQNYQAHAPGRFRLPAFTIQVDDETVQSEGTILVVRPSATAPAPTTLTAITPPPNGAAFLSLRTSKSTIYAGESLAMTLSFFVADNYPYQLQFMSLEKQLQEITKKIHPANAWEENMNIRELNPIPVLVGGKKFREYRLYQSVFFPLSKQTLNIPAVSLWLGRQPVIGPSSSKPETLVLTSKAVTVTVRQLPAHPLRGRVPVGAFRLEEGLERQRVGIGQSVRYTFTVTGEGNIATLPAPALLSDTTNIDVFPPEERHTVSNDGITVTGRKVFSYFLVPHQNGSISLANRFQWIYFDPQTGRYDTLQPKLQVRVGGENVSGRAGQDSVAGSVSGSEQVKPANDSLYAGIESMDSTEQPISIPILIRSIANVLIVLMLLGMIFVFFKK